MSIVCPCITAKTEDYTKQLEAVASFAKRLHIDIADGVFSPTELIPPQNLHWPSDIQADVHVMYQHPLEIVETLVALRPHLVVLHAEADGVAEALNKLGQLGIACGLALLAETAVATIEPFIEQLQQVLIFSGTLGYFGGEADLALLAKVEEIKKLKPNVEVAWDGGVNASNAKALAAAGIDVLNAGGAIQTAESPHQAYDQIRQAIQ